MGWVGESWSWCVHACRGHRLKPQTGKYDAITTVWTEVKGSQSTGTTASCKASKGLEAHKNDKSTDIYNCIKTLFSQDYIIHSHLHVYNMFNKICFAKSIQIVTNITRT